MAEHRASALPAFVVALLVLAAATQRRADGRVRADVADAAGDIGHALLEAGLVRPYHGERRESWCGVT